MSRPNAALSLPFDERPPAYVPDAPEQHPPGEAATATTGASTPIPPALGGHSIAEQLQAIDMVLALLAREYMAVCAARALINENVGTIVMRTPASAFSLEVDQLKTLALKLERSVGRARRT